jgi:alpha-beta hydrolase superfamily lysophospholipase
MNTARLKRWAFRLAVAFCCLLVLILFVALPIGGSFLITSARFRFPERGPGTPDAVGLSVIDAQFTSSDGIELKGWWNPGEASRPVIIFVHGLNRSRLELLERAAETNRRGYGVLLFDLRNHGESGEALTTIGVSESQDVCAASAWTQQKAGGRPQVLWGVSMGASSAILAAQRCPGIAAIVSDSSFLSFRDTIAHHLTLFFRLPSFPISNLIVMITAMRTGIDPDDGDVEAAVRQLRIPILFIAGSADRRMPPAMAERLLNAASHPSKKLVVVPGAGHGNAFERDRDLYLNTVFPFLDVHVSSAIQ